MFEDFARTTQQYGRPLNPLDTCDMIDAVQRADIVKVANAMMMTKPAVSIMGTLKDDFDKQSLYDDICMAQFNNQPLVSNHSATIIKDSNFR